MPYAISQHPNALLTPEGRRMVLCVIDQVGLSKRPRKGSRSMLRRLVSGKTGSWFKAIPVCWNGQLTDLATQS